MSELLLSAYLNQPILPPHPLFFAWSINQPAPGGESSQQIVVGVELEVRRANGDPVTSRVVDHVGVRVSDDAVLSAELGGSGSVSVVSG